jgi:plastocyanin
MKRENFWILPIVGMLIIISLFAGCTSTNTGYQTPSLAITQPQNGATLSAGNVMVKVQVSNFKLVDKLGQTNVAGEGHIHYFMDVTPPTTANQPATTAPGTWVATVNTSYTWMNVSAGSHTFSAELVNNDHTPLTPPIVSSVTVTVQGNTSGGSPTISITQPDNGASVTAGDITVSVDVSNFKLVDKLGQTNVAGEGHIHYFLDVTPPTTQGQPAIPPNGSIWAATASTTYTFKNVSAGSHTISVELVNNDHTPLQPPVTASVSITVTSSGGGSGQTAVIYLKAHNIAYNLSTITVPAGATVIVHFENDDAGIPHNFAVYDSSAAKTTIFKGEIITGVSSTTYTFTAPSTPGHYFFRCDVHPTIMTGTFIVT